MNQWTKLLRYIAGTKGATIHQLGQHFNFSVGTDGLSFQSGTFRLEGVKIGLEGNHQCHNAALALEIVHSQQRLRPVTVSATLRGLAQVQHSGRLEWLTDTVLLDAAHNPAGAEKLAEVPSRDQTDKSTAHHPVVGVFKGEESAVNQCNWEVLSIRIFATHCPIHERNHPARSFVKSKLIHPSLIWGM